MAYTTVPQMFLNLCDKFKDSKTAFTYKKDKQYVTMHYEELKEKVQSLAMSLLNLGIRKGDRIGIASENRIEWILSDFAITSIGAVDVPVFPTLTAKQMEYVFSDCEVTAIIVSNKFQLRKVMDFKDNLPSLRHVIVMEPFKDEEDLAVKFIQDLIDRGRGLRSPEDREKTFRKKAEKVTADDLLTLIYTSGTTGNPKGVMLTHRNVMTNVKDIRNHIYFDHEDTFLSYLPLCHSYERTTAFYAGFASGATVALAESIEMVAANMQEVQPTMMTTVPRLLEMIKKKIYNNIQRESSAKQKIFHKAVNVGMKHLNAKQSGKMALFTAAKYKVADKLVFGKLREKTGGKLRMFISGGAALAAEVNEFFLAAGFVVCEGYGLTEASPVIAANKENTIELATVGRRMESVEVKIAKDGEILARGDSIMKGYWNDERATMEAIDEEGWLYTGDIGLITEKGNLKITDRKKNLFVSNGGKNIAPQPIETLLCQSLYIDHVVLLGDKRDFVTALISPDFERIKELAETIDIKYHSVSELISNTKIIRIIKSDIDNLQKDLAKYERVRRFQLLGEPFSVEGGELTPKMSIKRHVVERKFSDLINKMYDLG